MVLAWHLRLVQRKLYAEFGAFTKLALDGYLSTVQFNSLLQNGQAKTCSGDLAHVVAEVERLKQVVDVVSWNPDAMILE